jgi:hypothetical protein
MSPHPNNLERKIATVRAAIAFLKDHDQHKMAEDVASLCRSAALIRATASSLHRELEETRRAAGMPTWERGNE